VRLKDVIPKFDKENRGYLLYDEFAKMIRSLGVKLNPVQLNDVIKGITHLLTFSVTHSLTN
jgi:Ca2+-binding EF-hand superfamily protein